MTDNPERTDEELLERLAGWVVERRMTAPAIIFLESHRPLSFVGSQVMIAASPLVSFFGPFFKASVGFDGEDFQRFAELMENRDNLERLIIEIERANQAASDREQEEKRRLKALKKEAKERRRALRKQKRKEDHG